VRIGFIKETDSRHHQIHSSFLMVHPRLVKLCSLWWLSQVGVSWVQSRCTLSTAECLLSLMAHIVVITWMKIIHGVVHRRDWACLQTPQRQWSWHQGNNRNQPWQPNRQCGYLRQYQRCLAILPGQQPHLAGRWSVTGQYLNWKEVRVCTLCVVERKHKCCTGVNALH